MITERPRIVIAGRPNVGKSTLFNRLYGRRRAITERSPGVTRDAIEEKCSLMGIPVTLIDTGGVKLEFQDEFDAIVARRSMRTIEHADIILLLLELGKLTAEDEHLIKLLRPETAKIILLVNKSDSLEKDYLAAEFYQLGLGEPVPISAVHGRNMDVLMHILQKRLKNFVPAGEGIEEEGRALSIALVGKPNAGKSTLANRLAGADYSLVSDIPGTTRDTVVAVNTHKGRSLKIIDTAGMRRKSKVSGDVEYYSVNRALQAMLEADVTVLMIDAKEGLSDQDKKISTQAVKRGRTVVMVMNKWDEEVPHPKRLKGASDKIRFQFPVLDWAPLIAVSALKGYGMDKLISLIIKADRQQNQRIDTGKLNKALSEWVDLTPPPTNKGRPFKVKYITQISTKPLRFVAFVNRKKGFPDSYRRFLVNSIRREFGFQLVPLDVDIKENQ